MEFDINKVYCSINADKLKVGSLIIVANNMMALRDRVASNHRPTSLTAIRDELGIQVCDRTNNRR